MFPYFILHAVLCHVQFCCCLFRPAFSDCLFFSTRHALAFRAVFSVLLPTWSGKRPLLLVSERDTQFPRYPLFLSDVEGIHRYGGRSVFRDDGVL